MAKRNWTDEEIKEYRRNHKSPFYYNKEDLNFVVNKRRGVGITINFANPKCLLFLGGTFLSIVVSVVVSKFLS